MRLLQTPTTCKISFSRITIYCVLARFFRISARASLYHSKDGNHEKVFDALEWLAAMCSHVPNKGEQMVRYYEYYSNVSRGKRKKQNQDGLIPCILEPEESSKEYRKNWARLIQKI